MKIIIIGSSTGGPFILEQVFAQFPVVPAAIIIIQHLPPSFIQPFRNHIAALTQMETRVIEDGSRISEKKIFIAQAGYHLLLVNNRDCMLDSGVKIHGVRPAIDRTMLSMQKRTDDHLMGIILTGMGQDGAEGMIHLHSCGAVTIVQDPGTAPIKSMPMAAIETGQIDHILPPDIIREKMIEFGSR